MAVLIGIPLSLASPSNKLFSRLSGFLVFAILSPLGLLTTLAWLMGKVFVARSVVNSLWEWELLGVWFSPFVCIVYLPLILQTMLLYLLP
jgi:glycosylphosphatidylinositol transamidase